MKQPLSFLRLPAGAKDPTLLLGVILSQNKRSLVGFMLAEFLGLCIVFQMSEETCTGTHEQCYEDSNSD